MLLGEPMPWRNTSCGTQKNQLLHVAFCIAPLGFEHIAIDLARPSSSTRFHALVIRFVFKK